MSYNTFIPIVANGLVFYIDSINNKSYSGSNLNDLTINSNLGTLTNGSSISDNSISFDGVDDYVLFPDSDSLSLVGDMSVNCWVKIFDFSNYRGIFSKVNVNAPNPFDCYLLPGSGQINFLRGDGINNAPVHVQWVTSINPPELNVWQNITITYESGVVTHYLNSDFNGTGFMDPIISDGGGPMYIGNRPDGATPMFGNISCLQIYNRSLTPNEVLQNYNAQKNRFI